MSHKLRNRLSPTSRNRFLRIVGIEAFEFHRKLDGSAWNPSGRWHERRAPLVRLVAEDGTAGVGEGWSEQTEIGAFFEQLSAASAWLLGQAGTDIGAVHAVLSAMTSQPDWAAPAVASAVDMALWDIRARRARQPVYAALGAGGGTVPVYASGGLYGTGKDLGDLAAEMQGYAMSGFTAVKMKIGGLQLPDDLARVAAVRHALRPDTAIMVDAVQQLAAGSAPDWVDALASLGVWGIQAPLPAGDLPGMAALQARGPLTVVAQEREYRPAAFQALLAQQAVGMLQFCPGLAGGFTGGLALAEMAQTAGLQVTLQCYSTAVMQAACFHLGAGRVAVHSVEYHRFHDHLHTAFPPAMLAVVKGRLHLDARPGLGIDPALLDRPPNGPGTLRRVFRAPD